MMRYIVALSILTGVFITSCNEKVDTNLKEALAIQDEAIHLGMDVNKEINSMIVADTSQENLQVLGNLLIRVKEWEKEMVPVPGLQHDHDHGHDHGNNKDSLSQGQTKKDSSHDHNHDHHGHVHASGDEIAAQLTPVENKEFQSEWKNRILALQAELVKYKKSKGK